jgi:hypothetical protein
MSAIDLSLLSNTGRKTVCLLILPLYSCAQHLHLRHRHKSTIPNVVLVQINVVTQGAGALGNDGTMIDGKGAILRGGRAYIRDGRAHFRDGGAEPPPSSPLTLSPA